MSPRVLTTIAMLLAGIALNLVVEVLLQNQKELHSLYSQLEEQRLTLQDLVMNNLPPQPETVEAEMAEIKE